MRWLSWGIIVSWLLVGCQPASTAQPLPEAAPAPVTEVSKAPAAEATQPAVKTEAARDDSASRAATPAERVFNPAKPPPGYSQCQAKECRTADGRILTYKQVMEEIGATRLIGGLDTTKLPEAPTDVAAPGEGAERTASGLTSRVLSPGSGTATPSATSRVLVHYSGWTTDGVAFDSSMARGRPSAFPLNRVIAGWQEALQLMVVGEKRRIWVPESLAYKGKAGGPSGTLVFDLELVDILTP